MQILLAPPLERKPKTYKACGFHLLLTLRGCDPSILNDQMKLEDLTRSAVAATNATILQICSQRFEPQGITTMAILAESHASLHTYPESNTVFWDCFTCGTECLPESSVPVLVEALKPGEVSQEIIYRH